LLSRKTRHRPRELMKKMAAAKLLLLRERGMLFEITLTQIGMTGLQTTGQRTGSGHPMEKLCSHLLLNKKKH
jgi:hypothetical protein